MPSNIDCGATHIASLSTISRRPQFLKELGAELLAGPLKAKGEVKQGERIWHFKHPVALC